MFKPARWRSDKNKIKAVFKLQFHATKVSWSGGDTLMISVIPAEGGKPTSILEKVKIRDGSCYWEKPVYEMVKFSRDHRTEKINDRLYHVIFSTGLSKFGLLGEVSINFADYAQATKISSLYLPIKNTKFEAVLHVTIERVKDSVGQRENEDGESLKDDSKDQSLRPHLSNSDIENHVKSLEFSDSLLNIGDLENHVKSLEEELEKQAQGFEADLENLTRSKVEQEQRAIRAEENLRKTRWQNANTADRLQEEFRRLSEQMASTFNANERLATKALTEANELRLEKTYSEEMLRQAKEEVQSVKEHYEAKLAELSRQLELKSNQIEKLQSEVEYKSTEFKNQRRHAEETQRTLSQKILLLQSEIGRLDRVNNVSSKQTEENEILRAELVQMKSSIRDTELLLEEGAAERKNLESMAALLKLEAQSLLKELDILSNAKDAAMSLTESLLSELETLKIQYNELKLFSTAEESQKEIYQKQVIQLRGELKKKEDALSIVEKKINDNFGRAPVPEVAKAKNNKYVPSPHASKWELVDLKEKIKLLEGKVKLKEVALEKSSNTFLLKEHDLQRKIEDLEKTLENLNQNAASYCRYECQKVKEDSGNLNAGIREAAIFGAQDVTTLKCKTEETRHPETLTESNNDISSNKDTKDSGTDSKDYANVDKSLNEMVLLKEKNQSMECELRDMQQRYSEISLKFAEVEGERQQLVMTLRNYKNSNKSWSLFT